MFAIYSGSVYIIPVSYSFSDQISSRDLRALTFLYLINVSLRIFCCSLSWIFVLFHCFAVILYGPFNQI